MLRMDRPLDRGSFHVFQGVYTDGLTASAGLRAWHDEIAYGMWGGPAGKEENEALARSYILDVTSHNINLQVANLASPAVQSFLRNPPGQQFAAAQGLRFVPDESEKWGVKNPYMFFIHDEPDCGDYRADGLAETKKVGALAQWCVLRGNELRAANPNVLNMLNLDMTYKPQNWYIYGQLPDVLSVDPYYQVRLATALWQRPNRVPLYTQATYISAVAEMTQSACEPNPLHVILYACSLIDKENKRVFPFPTPQSKRIEVYYALAGGAKGLSYWWYNPSLDLSKVTKKSSHGVGAAMMMGDAAAGALWKEIGLLGAEVRTAGPVLLRSFPADLDIEATDGLWVRSLLTGQDGLVLLVVNDRYANSEKGTRYQALAKGAVTVKLPSWMRSPTAFEVTARGTQNVALKTAGARATVDLGRVNLTRMIVVTSDTELRGQLQRVYDTQFREKVARLEMKPTAPPRRR
jgi:hypothetical protein